MAAISENARFCLVLYTWNFDRSQSKSLFNFVNKYFNSNDLKFSFLGYYDETYEDKYIRIESFNSDAIVWDHLVNFSLDKDDQRKESSTYGVEFNVTRPIHLTFHYSLDLDFDIVDFANQVSSFFPISFGFKYCTVDGKWPTAYAIGDWAHVKGVLDIKRLSRKEIERWNANCEKIQNGFVRDVYGDNIVSDKFLQQGFEGKTVQDYIQELGLGIIIPVNSNLFLWKLTSGELKRARNERVIKQLII